MLALLSPYKKKTAADPLAAQTVLLMHMDAAGFPDVKGHAIVNNTATRDVNKKKFGASSAAMTNHNTWLEVQTNADFTFTGDFTVEGWIAIASTGNMGAIFCGRWGIGPNTAADWIINIAGGSVQFTGGATALNTAAGAIPYDSNFHHIAVERFGNTLSIYVDGVSKANGAMNSGTGSNGGRNLRIGIYDDGGSFLNGWVDEYRITKGAARYKGNFAVPTAAFPD